MEIAVSNVIIALESGELDNEISEHSTTAIQDRDMNVAVSNVLIALENGELDNEEEANGNQQTLQTEHRQHIEFQGNIEANMAVPAEREGMYDELLAYNSKLPPWRHCSVAKRTW